VQEKCNRWRSGYQGDSRCFTREAGAATLTGMLLGIDLGTSGAKAGLFDVSGTLLGLGRGAGYRFASPAPGWAECDPSGWWPAVRDAVRAAVTAAPGARVEAIGLSTFFPAVAPVGPDGRALRPALLYSDQRSGAQVRAIESRVPRAEYESLIGNRLACGNTAAASMLWVRDNEPELYARAAVMAFADTIVLHRLTGRFVTDWSQSSLSGLVDIREPGVWSSRLCAVVGIEPRLLPAILGPLHAAGGLTRDAAADLGLAPGIPVICGAGDTVASAIGTGLFADGEVVYSSGTTDNFSVVLSAPAPDRRWINVGYAGRGQWLGIGANTSAGLSVEWFGREVLGAEGAAAAELARDLAAVAPSGRLVYLPYLQGERTPLWDASARGLFLGLSASTTRGELARAMFEGTAFSARHILECLEEMSGRRVGTVPAVGGGTRNPVWNRIKADVLQRPLKVLRFQETAALGAAVMAGIGAGLYRSPEAAAHAVRSAQESDRVDPDPAAAWGYDRLYRIYRDAYERTRDLMHALADNGSDDGGRGP
jgi:xylulokinase